VRRGIAWLHAELPSLVDRGVITAETAEALRRHYGPPDTAGAAGRLGQIALASIGALLVGGGLILIVAHNWESLDRPARGAIAIGLLLVAQSLTFYAIRRRGSSTAWREATAAFLVASVGASIALVGQTYHLGGTFEDLLRAWLWLVVPIPYLTRSTLAAIGVWALLVVRIFPVSPYSPPLDIWALGFAAAPFVVMRVRRAPESWATTVLALVAAGSAFIVGTALTVDRQWSQLWFLFEVPFVAAVIAAASWPPLADRAAWQRRLLHPAWLLLIVVVTILSFDDVWRRFDPTFGAGLQGFGPVSLGDPHVVVVLAVAAGCVAWASFVTISLTQAGEFAAALGCGTAALVAGLYMIARGGPPHFEWLVFNLWLLAVGAVTLKEGFRRMEFGTANRGLLAIGAFLIARFFDTDVSFLLRGVAFVALGAGCLGVNIWLARRGGRSA
jgi:uncharacterized membrane protein